MNDQKIIRHFNQIASNYDNFKKSHNIYFKTLKRVINDEIYKSANILDVGCGTGIILNFLNPERGLGIDVSPAMIKNAKKKYLNKQNLKFKVHDITKKTIIGKFDFILLSDVIEHLSNPNLCIKNIGKMMNNHTKLILTMANPVWEPILVILEKLRLKMPEGPHRRISEKELLNLLILNNLGIIKRKSYLPLIYSPINPMLGLIYVYIIKKNKKS